MKFSDSNIYVSKKKCVPVAVFMLVILCGIILGTALICVTDNPDKFYRLLFTHNLYKTKADIIFADMFLRDFLPVAFVLVVQLFSGYFAFGQLLAYSTLIYRGMVTGISASFTYIILGGQGFFAVLFSVIPFAVTTAAVLLLGARETVRQSKQIAEFSFFGNSDADSPDTKLYLLRFAVLVIAAALLSLADGLAAVLLWNRIFY